MSDPYLHRDAVPFGRDYAFTVSESAELRLAAPNSVCVLM